MPNAAGPPILTQKVSKAYGSLLAVDGVDLTIEAGEVFALLGPNGAGKTTLVEILEGYRRRSGGDVTVLGEDPGRAGAAWRARIGIVLQEAGTIEELTVREVIRHFASFYPDPLDPDRVIEMVGLDEKRDARGVNLSGGQKRRLDLALGVVGNPELIFLDEPTTGFDPAARRQAWEVVRELTALGRTIVLTTHYLDEAEALAKRVGVIAQGRLLDAGTPRELRERTVGTAVVSFLRGDALGARPLPESWANAVEGPDGTVAMESADPTHLLRDLMAWCDAAGCAEVPELSVRRPSLEEVYLRIIAAAGRVPAETVR